MNIQYNCPKCGARMTFDRTNGCLRCIACKQEEKIAGYQPSYKAVEAQTTEAYYGDNEARQYRCKHCGAIFVTDNHTSVENCLFCGMQTGIGERASDEPAPVEILPFRISKKEAEHAFHTWRKRLHFAPKDFLKTAKEKKMIGMYIPFWNFSLRAQGEAQFEGFQTEKYTKENEEVTQKNRFHLYRQADIALEHLPINASKVLPDKLFEKLEPFDMNAAQHFRARDLSGSVSEKYSINAKEALSKANRRAQTYLDDFLSKTVTNYEDTSIIDREYHIQPVSSAYTLLPVWFVLCDASDDDYIFAMNGQTGKLAGTPPVSTVKLAISFGLLTLVIFMILRIITVLLGGPLL